MTRIAPDRVLFLKFVVAAGLSVPVNLGSRILFSRAMSFEAAIVLSHVCGMVTAYLLTKLFVFEPSGRKAASELSRFAVVNLASVAQTWIVAVGLVRFVFPALGVVRGAELLAHGTGLAFTAFTSFYGHRHFSFGKT